MAKELGPRGIRVNAVCPGLTGTSFHDTLSKAEVRKAVAAAPSLRREGKRLKGPISSPVSPPTPRAL